jgi:hypothetical protein
VFIGVEVTSEFGALMFILGAIGAMRFMLLAAVGVWFVGGAGKPEHGDAADPRGGAAAAPGRISR